MALGRTFVYAAKDVKGPGGVAVELHCLVWKESMFCVEGIDHALQLWWEVNVRKDLEETVKIKRLCGINESYIQGQLLFSALLLELAKEDHVYC